MIISFDVTELENFTSHTEKLKITDRKIHYPKGVYAYII